MSIDNAPRLSDDTLASLNGPGVRALVVYGSVARGEDTPESDIDILQIVTTPREQFVLSDNIQVAPYTFERLVQLARRGSLFIAHLIEEGKALHDPEHLFQQLRDSFVQLPQDVELRQLRVASGLLDVTSGTYDDFWPGLHTCAAFTLRSLCYLRARERGCRTFSLSRVADFLGDSRLNRISLLRHLKTPDESVFRSIITTIEEYQGSPVTNPYGSIAALTVNAWFTYDLTAAWGLRIISKDLVRLTYG